MDINHLNKAVPVRAVPRCLRVAAAAGLASIGSFAITAAALAQSPIGGGGGGTSGGIGNQLVTMTGEALDAGGTFGGGVMYLCALIVFIGAVWALWKSRQPQGRETGYVGMGVAGLILCGLFATGGSWINKAAVTASGNAATVNSTAKVVTFQ